MNNLEKILFGNKFKGFLVSNEGIAIKYFIDPIFLKQLVSIHKPKNKTIDVPDEFKIYSENLQKKFKREEKNFSLFNIFNSSPYVNHQDWLESFTSYLKKIYYCLLTDNTDTRLLEKIKTIFTEYEIDLKELLIDDEVNTKEIEEARKKIKRGLDADLIFVSNFGIAFNEIAENSDYTLRTLSFVDTINEHSPEFAKGTSFWFFRLSNLITMSIYQFLLNNQHSILFNESTNEFLSLEFIRIFNDILGDPSENYNNKDFESLVKSKYNESIINNDKINIKPIFYFGTQDKMEVFNEGNQLTITQKNNLISLSMACEVVEEHLYKKRIKPKLSLIFFKQKLDDYLVIQKSDKNQSLGVLYKALPGKQLFSEVLTIHEKLFNKYLSKDITTIEEDFISEIQDYFILKDLKNK